MMILRILSLSSLVLLVAVVCVRGQSERDDVFAQYATLKTVAGLGEEEDANFWIPAFEGAKASEIELSNPHMTMADAAGNLYVADKESHSILRIDTEGRVHTHAGTHAAGYNGDEGVATEIQLDNPNGLFVHPNGVVFILDFFNQRVRRVGLDGQLTTVFHDESGFGPGRGLWVSPDESLIYHNGPSSVKRWTPEEGSVELAAVSDPGNLTVDPDGKLVLTSRGDHLVYRLEDDSTLTVIAGDGSEDESSSDGVPATSVGLESARSVAFLPNGGYFIATQKGGDIWYVDTDGLIHRFLSGARRGNVRTGDGERFSTPGTKIAEPRAISLAPNGDLLITTNDSGYVRVVERFQTPGVDVSVSKEVVVTVTAGREHRVETSGDLVQWQTWQVLGSGQTEGRWVLPGEQPFVRVAW